MTLDSTGLCRCCTVDDCDLLAARMCVTSLFLLLLTVHADPILRNEERRLSKDNIGIVTSVGAAMR